MTKVIIGKRRKIKVTRCSPFYRRVYFKRYWSKPTLVAQASKRWVIRRPSLAMVQARQLEQQAHRVIWDEPSQYYCCPACHYVAVASNGSGTQQRFNLAICTALPFYDSYQAYQEVGLASWSKLNEANLIPDGPPRGRAYYASKDVWYELYSRDECIPKSTPNLLTEPELMQLLSQITIGLRELGFDIFQNARNFERFLWTLDITTKCWFEEQAPEIGLARDLAANLLRSQRNISPFTT